MAGQGKPLKKECNRCRETKRLSDYYYNRSKPDYHNGICKKCQLEVNNQNKAKTAKAS